jgi:hypothetical protein
MLGVGVLGLSLLAWFAPDAYRHLSRAFLNMQGFAPLRKQRHEFLDTPEYIGEARAWTTLIAVAIIASIVTIVLARR